MYSIFYQGNISVSVFMDLRIGGMKYKILVIFVRLVSVFGITSKYPFTASDVCYQVYNYVIDDVYGIESMMSCSAVCIRNGCCSLLYDSTSERCITYSYFAPSKTYGCSWKYLEINASYCDGPHPYQPSSPNTCDHGYSYDASNDLCVIECVSYGSTFGTFPGRVLSGFNDDSFDVTSEQECRNACVAATAFVCRTAELSSSNKCYLSVDTALTQPSGYQESTTYTLWHRNCA